MYFISNAMLHGNCLKIINSEKQQNNVRSNIFCHGNYPDIAANYEQHNIYIVYVIMEIFEFIFLSC